MRAETRSFLFLQGPHGPFLAALGAAIVARGCRVARVGFNAGDAAEWPDRESFLPFSAPPEAWPGFLRMQLARRGVTDLLMYGDARPLHAQAAGLARGLGVRVHWLEEGYLRPHWITHEIGGVNGASRLATEPVARIRAAAARLDPALPATPDGWGAARAHAWHGAVHHARMLAGARHWPHWQSHRSPGVAREAWLHALRLLTAPGRTLAARARGAALRVSGRPFHLVLLQLGHDGAFLRHGPFRDQAAFIAHVLDAFAAGAPPGDRLVFKTHPFEDLRAPLPRLLARMARDRGLSRRVRLIHGGPLGPLLDAARSAVTVNSTAGQQALWRGLPLAALGASVYAKPGLVSGRDLPAFFAAPEPPDPGLVADLRRVLLATSQIAGDFYTRAGMARAVPILAGRLAAGTDAHATVFDGLPAPVAEMIPSGHGIV